MKKTMILLICALLIASSLTSCTNTETVSETDAPETPAVETEKEFSDNVPQDLTFQGAAFCILAGEEYGCISLVEEMNGDVLNDAKYNMETYTEERLDVQISENTMPYWSAIQTVNNLVASGDTEYDYISMTDRHSVACAREGAFFMMADIPYVDLAQPYWGEGLSDKLSIGGKYYFAVSSFNLYSLDRTAFLCFNEEVAKNHGIQVPFDDVFNGTWTLDKLESYGSIATNDVNGDGIMDRNDSYTYGTCDVRDVGEKFLYAADVPLIEINSDGLPYVYIFGNEKFVDVLERSRAMFYTDNCAATADDIITLDLFMADRELITLMEFYAIESFRDMSSDFSILPMPKFDENQKEYRSRTNNVIFSMVPVTATDLEKAGAVAEVMCCYGYKNLLPAYIESTMQRKVARNEESAKTIQIIYDSRVLDLGKLYLTYFSTAWYQDLFAGKNVVTQMEAQQKAIETAMEESNNALLEKTQ